MTAIIIANSIAAAVVVLGLAAVIRLGHQTAGGRFNQAVHRLELHRGAGAEQRAPERRAA
jgi:hypothetical protein